jgi:hypothetical protein
VGDRRITMASKCIRKIMGAMMELLIIIHFEVQAKNVIPSSFCPSVRTPLPCNSKLDQFRGPFIICITNRIKKCEAWLKVKNAKEREFAFDSCIGLIFGLCHKHIKEIDDPIVPIIEGCVEDCLDNRKELNPRVACILLRCFLHHINKSYPRPPP